MPHHGKLSPNNQWFTEECTECGSAFSLTIKGCLHQEQTPFQTIAIFETETFGNLMTIDGFIMLSSRDNFLYHEMMAHPVLFTHPAPKKILIIGGGDCGTLQEVLRHPDVTSVLQVDIDERVTRLSEQFFPELCQSNHDPRAELHFADGIKWLKECQAGSYDVVIVDSTDPIGPAEGLFGAAFYRTVHAALAEGGLMVHQSESPLVHIDLLKSMRDAMIEGGFSELQTIQFPQPVYPTGWWTCTLATKNGPLPEPRYKDAQQRSFETLYYTPQIHQGAASLPPFLAKALGLAP